MAPTEFNRKNPAVRRILQEIKEVQADESGDLMAEALESDIFEWHFAVRGPPGTDFEGGIYHGRILLPAEYPFKPPSFIMLTPSGRFQTGVQICLSISAHHPEHWQPSWSVRTALTALIAFMPSPGAGALGSLDYTGDERRKLAAKSRLEPPKWGSPERQRIINEMHARMLASGPSTSTSTPTPQEGEVHPPATRPAAEGQESPATPRVATPATATQAVQGSPNQPPEAGPSPPAAIPKVSPSPAPPMASPSPAPSETRILHPSTAASVSSTPAKASASPVPPVQQAVQASGTPHITPASTPARGVAMPTGGMSPVARGVHTGPAPVAAAHPAPDTWGLTVLAVALGILIAAILVRKVLAAAGYPVPSLAAGLSSSATPHHQGL